jgi:hypothetical protein
MTQNVLALRNREVYNAFNGSVLMKSEGQVTVIQSMWKLCHRQRREKFFALTDNN